MALITTLAETEYEWKHYEKQYVREITLRTQVVALKEIERIKELDNRVEFGVDPVEPVYKPRNM
jgi:hypothetical protein